jgi:hypothetical protein
METSMNTERQAHKAEIQFASMGFAGAGGRLAASSLPRFAPMDRAIGLARDAQIYSQIASPASRNPAKYPG